MLKKFIISVMTISFLLISCASISFNPETGKASYTRIGDQHIQGLDMSKNTDGTFRLKLNNQQSDAEVLNELIQLLRVMQSVK